MRFCVGMASVARHGARYLRTAVASLLEGLTQEERNQIHLVVFIAEINATLHPAYGETWLDDLADQVLLYDLPQGKLNHFEALNGTPALDREKMLFDYMYLMKACQAEEAPYIALFEDDILAMDGWFHRTMSGPREAEKRTAARGNPTDFLYLRLFHTEEFLGWNAEDLPVHVFWSLAALLGCGGCLAVLRTCSPRLHQYLSLRVLLTICCLYVPLCILLFFGTGRVTTNPLPRPIAKMNNYGCCTQGLAFPRHKTEDLIRRYEAAPRSGWRDSLIEQYADRHGELRWALSPSVIQHIGRTTSKEGTDPSSGKG